MLSPVAMAEKYLGASFGFTEVANNVSSDESVTFKIYAGSKSKFFGYEAAYMGFDNFSATGNGVSGRAIELSALVYFPLKAGINIFAKYGVFPYDLSGNSTRSVIDTGSGVSTSYGGGMQFDVSKSLSMKVENQRHNDVGNVEMSFLSVGIGIRF